MDELMNYGGMGILVAFLLRLVWYYIKVREKLEKEHRTEMKALTEDYLKSVEKFTETTNDFVKSETQQAEMMKDIKGIVISTKDEIMKLTAKKP